MTSDRNTTAGRHEEIITKSCHAKRGKLTGISRAAIIAIFLIGSSGCQNVAGGDSGSIVTSEQKSAIVPDKTTKTEVLRELGNPDQRIDFGNNKEQFSYITITKQKGVSPPGDANGESGLSDNKEFWILFENNVVKKKGERTTTKAPLLSK